MSCTVGGIHRRGERCQQIFSALLQTSLSGLDFKHLKTRRPARKHTHTHTQIVCAMYVCVCVHFGVLWGSDKWTMCVLVLQGIFPPKWLWLLWVLRNQVLLSLFLSLSLSLCACVCLCVCVWPHIGKLSSEAFSPCSTAILRFTPKPPVDRHYVVCVWSGGGWGTQKGGQNQ